MKYKKMIATLMLSTSILGTLTPMVPTLAAENNQVVATTTDQTSQEVINFPDEALRSELKIVLSAREGVPLDTIKDSDLTKNRLSQLCRIGIYPGVKSLEGVEQIPNLRACVTDNTDLSHIDFSYLPNSVSYLYLNNDNLTQKQFDQLFRRGFTTNLTLNDNHIYDLSKIGNASLVNLRVFNQTFTEDKQEVVGDEFILKVRDIKNVDGSTPTITPSNGGVYDARLGVITWKGLPKETTSLSYKWSGANNFTGTVTVPVRVIENQEVINFPDEALRSELKIVLSAREGVPLDTIKDSDLTKNRLSQLCRIGIYPGVKSLEGVEQIPNLRACVTDNTDLSHIDFSYLPNSVSYLYLNNDNLTQKQFDQLFRRGFTTNLTLNDNHIYDLSKIGNASLLNLSVFNQTLTEDKQEVIGDTLTIKVKDIKNIDGSTPKITPNNGGVYDAEKGTITWTGLTKETTSLSYQWSGANCFTGTVTIPIEVKKMVTTCHIVPVFAPTKCLDNNPNNTNLFLWSKVNQAANHWFTFHTVKEDIVKISSKDNSRWLTTKGVQGNTITQTRNEQEASYWQMKHLDNNKIVLHYMGNKEAEIKDTNLSLNICGGKSTDGTLAILYSSSYDNYPNQQFLLEK